MTRIDGALARLLGPEPRSAARQASSGSGVNFAELLSQAKKGDVSTGLPVELAKNVKVELNAEQMGQLAVAADRAASQGATRALVLMDNMAIKLDVTTRQVLGSVNLADGRAMTGIDAVIQMPGASGGKSAGMPADPPRTSIGNASLLSALARRESDEQDAA